VGGKRQSQRDCAGSLRGACISFVSMGAVTATVTVQEPLFPISLLLAKEDAEERRPSRTSVEGARDMR